jgi:chorismate mutase
MRLSGGKKTYLQRAHVALDTLREQINHVDDELFQPLAQRMKMQMRSASTRRITM